MSLSQDQKRQILIRVFSLPSKQKSAFCAKCGKSIDLSLLDLGTTKLIQVLDHPPESLSPLSQNGNSLQYYEIHTEAQCPDCGSSLVHMVIGPE